MLEFNLFQNMMAGTKLSHPNDKIQFCPMEDTFVQSIDRHIFLHTPSTIYCTVRADTLSCETLS
jgi:hypothetical protein